METAVINTGSTAATSSEIGSVTTRAMTSSSTGLASTSTVRSSSFMPTSIATIDSTVSGGMTTLVSSNTTIYENSSICRLPRDEYLESLQEQTTVAMIPAMIYLIILAVVGLFGNSLVLFVYSRKFKQNSTRVFIMAIASFDIVTNVVAIPGEIYDMFYTWDFNQPLLCKTRLFFNAFTTMVAAMVLVAIAVVRYRKICKPFKTQVTIKLAKIISVILAASSLLFSVPYAIINGRQTKLTFCPNITGFECTIDDSYVPTIWPLINGTFFIFLFIVCTIPLVIMYTKIGITAWKHSKGFGVNSNSNNQGKAHDSDSGPTNGTGTKSTEDTPLKLTSTSKTRSIVNTNGDSSGGQIMTDSEKNNGNKNQFYDRTEKENKNKDSNNEDDGGDDGDDNIIEYQDNSAIRMIRSPTGEKVHINLLMVRELTVKLRAVKKEADKRKSEDDINSKDSEKAENERKGINPSDISQENKKNENGNTENESSDVKDADNLNKEESDRASKMKVPRNKSTDNNLSVHLSAFSIPSPSRRFSKSMGDLTRLTEKQCLGKDITKAAENEDLDFRGDSRSFLDRQSSAKIEESEEPKDEPLSEFAKAMQWVDLTYCLSEKKENEMKNESNGEEPDTSNLSKKGSFALGRKISRDNSFLQRHRKLKDALTDTLTRARKSRKEREAAESEAKEHYGITALESINSESENTRNEDANNETNDNNSSSNKTDLQHEDIGLRQKTSRAKDLVQNEHGNKPNVDKNRTRRQGIGRTTVMLILITAVYILGFLPYLSLTFAKHSAPETFRTLQGAPLALYNLFLRSYFLNSAANPIIYSLCDFNFRRECCGLLKCS